MKRLACLLMMTALVLGAAGCGMSSSASAEPKIRYGKDVCSSCKMIISEERFAAAVVKEPEEVYRFDGIGCMQEFLKTHSDPGDRVWVHDFKTQKWIDAQSATIVHRPEKITPMGDGLVAFSKEENQK